MKRSVRCTEKMDSIVKKIIKKIENAFDGVKKPENVTMRVARAIDDYITEDEFADLRKKEIETKWQDIPDSDIEFYDDILTYLSPIGMRYYLPRYMTWSLHNFKNSDLAIPDYVIFRLNNSTPEEWDLFDKNQRSACIEFLKFCADHEGNYFDSDLAKNCISLLESRGAPNQADAPDRKNLRGIS